MRMYHTGYERIEAPDISRGRANADFGRGFYLSDDREFSRRWARVRKGGDTYLNAYELDPEGLEIKYFERGREWFDYIYANRAGHRDSLPQYDVIVGPIANDTLYDTFGIFTGGVLDRGQATQLLMLGGVYNQTVIKTEKALKQLCFVSAQILPQAEIAGYRETVRKEQEAFLAAVAEALEGMQ